LSDIQDVVFKRKISPSPKKIAALNYYRVTISIPVIIDGTVPIVGAGFG